MAKKVARTYTFETEEHRGETEIPLKISKIYIYAACIGKGGVATWSMCTPIVEDRACKLLRLRLRFSRCCVWMVIISMILLE
jgi:hypothetical protein